MESRLRNTFTCLFLLSSMSISHSQRRWLFAFSNDGWPADYVENGKLVGQSVDMVMEICKHAKKDCQATLVQRSQCWQALDGYPPYSSVLNGRWFDACANLPKSPERAFSYAFATEPFLRVDDYELIVAANSRITLQTLQTCHNKTLAYPGNTALEPDCLMAHELFVKEDKYRPIVLEEGDLIDTMKEIVKMVAKGQVDLGLTINRFLGTELKGVKSIKRLECVKELEQGLNVMFRSDDVDFVRWWNSAVKQYVCSNQYTQFCKELFTKYNKDPLCRVPGKHIDCQKFGGPILEKGVADEIINFNPCQTDCRRVEILTAKSRHFFNVNGEKDPEYALRGSGKVWVGRQKMNGAIGVRAKTEQLFRMDEVCIETLYAKSVKFIFRGGDREGEEVNVPVQDEKKWSQSCAFRRGFRRNTKIDMRKINNPINREEQKIQARDLYLKACV